MPPKEVTCKVCGETVLKSQTYAYEGGRACKHHEGVEEAKDSRMAAEKKKRHADIRPEPEQHDHTKCCICGDKGRSFIVLFGSLLARLGVPEASIYGDAYEKFKDAFLSLPKEEANLLVETLNDEAVVCVPCLIVNRLTHIELQRISNEILKIRLNTDNSDLFLFLNKAAEFGEALIEAQRNMYIGPCQICGAMLRRDGETEWVCMDNTIYCLHHPGVKELYDMALAGAFDAEAS